MGGAPVDGLEKFPHRVPMLSLSNAFEAQDLVDFEERIRKQLGDLAPRPSVLWSNLSLMGWPWSWCTRTAD